MLKICIGSVYWKLQNANERNQRSKQIATFNIHEVKH